MPTEVERAQHNETTTPTRVELWVRRSAGRLRLESLQRGIVLCELQGDDELDQSNKLNQIFTFHFVFDSMVASQHRLMFYQPKGRRKAEL